FAVDADSIPAELEVTHVNMADGSVEGVRHKTHPALGVEFDPIGEPAADGKPCYFPEFLQLIRDFKK
ncbi:MAG: carbamoyl phosphate synthase small subunit, partial [Akkermansia sp.]|nr:carbamoyl phosphate synthase small subunit [Akkermansia sp.]